MMSDDLMGIIDHTIWDLHWRLLTPSKVRVVFSSSISEKIQVDVTLNEPFLSPSGITSQNFRLIGSKVVYSNGSWKIEPSTTDTPGRT